MKYQINDNADTWEVEAKNANEAVESVYSTLGDYGIDQLAVKILRPAGDEADEWKPCLYALIEQDEEGEIDHSSWSPKMSGPIENEWEPVWIEQA